MDNLRNNFVRPFALSRFAFLREAISKRRGRETFERKFRKDKLHAMSNFVFLCCLVSRDKLIEPSDSEFEVSFKPIEPS